jgi:sarcosine oxidase subunit gamma
VVDGVGIEEVSAFGLTAISARRGASPIDIGKAVAIEMPVGPTWIAKGPMAMIGSGPGSWLACHGSPEPGWHAHLEQRLAGLASVSDQTGAYRMFRIAGPRAEPLLQRGLAIDLDAARFPPGAAAISLIAHIDVIVRRLDDALFEVAVYRSYANSLLSWFNGAIAGLGDGEE